MGIYGTCVHCGFEASDFESARIHIRDSEGLGIVPRLASHFDKPEDN